MRKVIYAGCFLLQGILLTGCSSDKMQPEGRWSREKAEAWGEQQEWIRGCNFTSSTAINQIEMWQEESFDPETIDRELSWARELGFNTMRVYLSSLVYESDPKGMKERMKQYLKLSDNHKIRTLFCFFDDCWNAESTLGKQPDPKPGVHNSGWVQDPAVSLREDTLTLYPKLEKYVRDIVGEFSDDPRVLGWDLYNEPGNSGHQEKSIPLLKNVFKWARAAHPSQPLTSGVFSFDVPEICQIQVDNSDIITYHNYFNQRNHEIQVQNLQLLGRPMICTEYMARPFDSRFENILPLLKKKRIGAINWGFVSGKTNTRFAWGEVRSDGSEPEVWFHDILRTDKTPYDQNEIDFLKSINRF